MSTETELDFDIEKMYSHEQVLEKTFLSRDSLRKMVSNKTFPAPSVYGKSAYKSNWYVKKEVDKWIYDNRPQFIPETFYGGEEVSVTLTTLQYIRLNKAADALNTDLQRYIADAIDRKTNIVLDHLNIE